ncbi:unnamed protein product [Closterium sp. Naga37s-1]|nr:unnamed protein product [Closterium sp. Naga37s-1]
MPPPIPYAPSYPLCPLVSPMPPPVPYAPSYPLCPLLSPMPPPIPYAPSIPPMLPSPTTQQVYVWVGSKPHPHGNVFSHASRALVLPLTHPYTQPPCSHAPIPQQVYVWVGLNTASHGTSLETSQVPSWQVYVWVGLNTASHGNVYTAIPTRFDPMPLVTPLIGGGAEGASATMAARLSKRLGCAVILASNIPPNAPMTEVSDHGGIVGNSRAIAD